MTIHQPAVSVIVPTLGLRERSALLLEALTSIKTQAGVDALPIVVLNGTRACPAVERKLADDPALQLIVRRQPGLPAALTAGRAAVRTPYFTTLDDDDLLLPGALALRLRALQADGSLDLVVTNGYRREGRRDELNIPSEMDIDGDALQALVHRNWLLPGSWLARSDRVGEGLFDGMPSYLECTFLAVRFATRHQLRWIADPTVVYRLGSPEAATASRDYMVGQAEAIRDLLEAELPDSIRNVFERRVADAYHAASDYDLEAGHLRDAWRWHLASLMGRGGLRYLAYTRHLLAAAIREAA